MEKNIIKRFVINGDMLRSLFASADKKIAIAKEKRLEGSTTVLAKKFDDGLEKLHTDIMVDKIVGLVYDVLTTIDAEKVLLSPVLVSKNGLGILTTVEECPSECEINDKELKIVLDYSSKSSYWHGKCGAGKCFINRKKHEYLKNKLVYFDSEDVEIDYPRLLQKLAKEGINFKFFDYFRREGVYDVFHQRVCIKFAREKKKTEDKEPYTKK